VSVTAGLWLASTGMTGALAESGTFAATPTEPPGNAWRTAAPESAGFDPRLLAGALTAVADHGVPVHSLLLGRGGRIVLDAYAHPSCATWPA
jgi:hypothetical protein